MFFSFFRTIFIVVFMMAVIAPESYVFASEDIQEGKIYVWVEKYFSSRENPLHSEFIVNGKTVNVFSSDTIEPIEEYLKPGLNTISIKTTAMEPANQRNDLIFRIGPMHRDPKDATRFIMAPILWKFRNGTDWKFKDGQFLHALGPDVKEVTLTYNLFWTGPGNENNRIKQHDFILKVEPYFTSRNSPVILSLSVNGTPFSSFIGAKRQIVITSLLHSGKNEIKLISHRVPDSFGRNDMEGSISGPAIWYPGEKKYMLKQILTFSAMSGWKKDKKTGQLVNQKDPSSDFFERTIVFMIKDLPEKDEKGSKLKVTPSSVNERRKI